MTTDFGFHKPWEKYKNITGQHKGYERLITRHKDEFGLKDVRSCLSIGSGTGELDLTLIEHCLPQLESFTAVEPDADNVVKLRASLEPHFTANNIELIIIQGKIEDSLQHLAAYDLIVSVEVWYYIANYKRVLAGLVDSLNLGGKLVVSGEGNGKKGNEQLATIDQLRESPWTDTADIRAELDIICPPTQTKTYRIDFLTCVGNADIDSLAVLLGRHSITPEEFYNAKERMLQFADDSGQLNISSVMDIHYFH